VKCRLIVSWQAWLTPVKRSTVALRAPELHSVAGTIMGWEFDGQMTIESIPIIVGREEDGRWWADIESMPGVMTYGDTRDSAIAAVRALALRVAADCIDHGEEIPEPFTKVFSVA